MASTTLATLAAALVAAPAALALPPANDAPEGAAFFAPYTTENGTPGATQAIGELVEASPDPQTPPCLGAKSFARTVWFRIPAALTPRELTVEAAGRTLAVPDLAMFVQFGANLPPVVNRPNACAGAGIGGGDATPDRAGAITIRIPENRDVLLQVGRRGKRGTPDDERVILTLGEQALPVEPPPPGDLADAATPLLNARGDAQVSLSGATITGEDPAVPECPALAGVWRKVKVPATGKWTFVAEGADATALSVFQGVQPTPNDLIACQDREGSGPLTLPVTSKRKKLLWVRVGTDRPVAGATTRLRFRRFAAGDVASGGACLGSDDSRVGGRVSPGPRSAKRRNRSRYLGLQMTVANGPVCNAALRIVGPSNRVYARGTVAILRGHGQPVVLQRLRKLKPGRYKLAVRAQGLAQRTVTLKSSLSFSLRK